MWSRDSHHTTRKKITNQHKKDKQNGKKSKLSRTTGFNMLSGPIGGVSCVEYFEKLFTKDVLKSKIKFEKTFLKSLYTPKLIKHYLFT